MEHLSSIKTVITGLGIFHFGHVRPKVNTSLTKVNISNSDSQYCEHQKYFWSIIVLPEKAEKKSEKNNCKQEHQLVCSFVASCYMSSPLLWLVLTQ